MATIVQPYNPWKEQLALTALGNVAGNILSDLWQSHRQNEQNRKANAFRGQLQQNLQNNAQPDISLMPKEAPQGYNSNPWANALHQNYTPLTAFDIGTSTVGKAPSIQDIVQGADSLAASKRFSMLSPELVQGVKNSIIQQSIADMFGNAGNVEDQMRALTMGAARGVVAPQVLTAFSPYARDVYSPYTFQETDLGQNKVLSALNKHTGVASPGMIMPVSVSPNTAANNATSRYVADRSAESSRYASDTQRYGYDSTSQWRNREIEDEERQREYDRQNPPLVQMQDSEGNYYGYNARNNEATPITDAEGYFIVGDTGKNPALTAAIKSIDTEMKELDDRAKAIRQMYIGADDLELTAMNAELAPILARQKELSEARQDYVDRLFPKEKTRRKPAQPQSTSTQPTATEIAGTVEPLTISADVQPVQRITALTPESADVSPTAQYTPPVTGDARPSYMRTNMSQALTGNPYVDVQSAQPITALTPNNAPQAPVQPQAPKPAPEQPQSRNNRRSMREFTVSDDMVYNPARDKDIPSTKVYTPEHFRDFILSMQNNPEFAKYSTEQLIAMAYDIGIRIRQ